MTPPHQRPWYHNVLQYTLLEYASLKQACPEGLYLSLKPGNPAQWSGILFVRKGSYAPAILRFNIAFPPDYPTLPPTITFTSDIFHPLVAPLTAYTYTTGSLSTDTVSATDEQRLPPGGFSLRYGFPHWFGRGKKCITSSAVSSRNSSSSYEGGRKQTIDNIEAPHLKGPSSRGSSQEFQQPSTRNTQRIPPDPGRPTSIIEVLEYVKRAFDDGTALDTLPLEAAGNSGAWKAWRAYRRSKDHEFRDGPETDAKQADEWNWDGVWQERVRKGIDASISESTLYGGAVGDDMIRFLDVNDDLIEDVKARVMDTASLGHNRRNHSSVFYKIGKDV